MSAGASATGICREHYYYNSISQELVLKDPGTKGDRRAWGWGDRDRMEWRMTLWRWMEGRWMELRIVRMRKTGLCQIIQSGKTYGGLTVFHVMWVRVHILYSKEATVIQHDGAHAAVQVWVAHFVPFCTFVSSRNKVFDKGFVLCSCWGFLILSKINETKTMIIKRLELNHIVGENMMEKTSCNNARTMF